MLRGGIYHGSNTNIASTVIVTDGLWHNAILVSSGLLQTLYLDGNLVGTVSGNVTQKGDKFDQFGSGYTGNWAGGNNSWSLLNGSMDDVRFYNRALTSAEITAIAEGAG